MTRPLRRARPPRRRSVALSDALWACGAGEARRARWHLVEQARVLGAEPATPRPARYVYYCTRRPLPLERVRFATYRQSFRASGHRCLACVDKARRRGAQARKAAR